MSPPVHALLDRLDHLSGQFAELRDGVQKAIRIAGEDPDMALTRARKVLEYIVRDVYERNIKEPPGTRPLENLLQRLVKDGYFPDRLDAYANTIRKLGNVGTHGFGEKVAEKVTVADVHQSLTQLLPILEWYFEVERPEALAGDTPSSSGEPRGVSPRGPTHPRRRSRGTWLIAGGAVGLAACVGVAVFWFLGSQPGGTPTSPASVPEPLRVRGIDVNHFSNIAGQNDQPRGRIGTDSFVTRCDDGVTIEARLSRPAYAFLIAFRPDGTEELCFPESEDEAPPLTDKPRYPSVSRGVNYGLNEGAGLEVFAVVASSQPLPAYRQWRGQRGTMPWRHLEAAPGVVYFDDGALFETWTAKNRDRSDRGKGQTSAARSAIVHLTDWLRQAPGTEATAALGFTVQATEKP
jgi:hypothetical protein